VASAGEKLAFGSYLDDGEIKAILSPPENQKYFFAPFFN
jgi:hypothetical protein